MCSTGEFGRCVRPASVIDEFERRVRSACSVGVFDRRVRSMRSFGVFVRRGPPVGPHHPGGDRRPGGFWAACRARRRRAVPA
ncbi:hypothetical protein DF122_07395 [Burkholderia pseudomallei]|nr:hypothetical protein [Burkholderia pseudomallei]NRD87383.1 hypothetical protein [Burkholderia pseudomallei]RSK69973.1 hypothetical protein DF122_07395 [Burkholderia pseudomallei]TXD00842.1 hypothetical protein FTI75_31070 [Burkholderia pseudomallei]